jgi:predicted RNA-binding Zn-ribbon protein involved in translation (DUF1610 family)
LGSSVFGKRGYVGLSLNMLEAPAISKAYNSDTMTKTKQVAKEGDKCLLCGEGTLAVSSSGRNLVCPKCGRIARLDDRPEPNAKVRHEA